MVSAPRDEIARFQLLAQPCADFEQEKIGHIGPEARTHTFEPVEIDQHQGKRFAGSAASEKNSLEPSARRLIEEIG